MIRFPLIDRLPISSTGANPASPRRPGALRRQAGLWGGMILFVAMVLMEPPSGMSSIAWYSASLAALMAVWWLSEAIPIAATALVPVALAPVFGLASVAQVTPHYANPLIFMFLGGFIIAIAMERWNLHRRIALMILKTVGFRPRALVGGFITATAFLSMWVSNTATATMMLPIALSIVNLLRDNETEPSRGIEDDDESVTEKLAPLTRNFALALLFGIAFGASIGGIGTLIGTPPNALLAGYLASNFDVSIGFGQWMMLGVPFAAVLLLFCWWILTSVVYPQADDLPENARHALARDIAALGPMSRGEKSVAIVFVATACLWLFRPLIEVALPDVPISDASIAMFAAIALFAIPVKARENLYVLDWKATLRLPWGVLLLVGGGLALGALINDSGLAAWIAGNAGALPDLPVFVQIGLIALMVILISHLTSNTATAATFLPLVATYALGEGIDPLLLAVPVAIAASCAFMLPVATPPNAIVFASGYLKIGDMVRAGAVVNLAGLALLVVFSMILVPILFK
ncbi:DASS family sodium-coupled anion symporter [Thalassospira sp. SN3W]|uniref:Sodium: dicarboxylate cotransporter n=1 Tax=Thalassospira xiamenensis M-5 = DSM 17429 TaxID=1123366 RepID=A0AB72UCC1_9PROT|nr:DASS family sodium-coupled anion symporter [Thalassospira xiamenensis]AJD51956.1 sodium: dicarboxylate cotransporter [Thalassospira xiamenensis M-5 = DSM 17429]SIS97406.1 solute carrier family 13 (sodium-dependent dicarboxylate transporter), member 2/3/5 [Thalassospira xiamenensis M-5 = DSM 17429]